jgi:hypothetical protein
MRTPRLPVVDWTEASADLNGLVRFAERQKSGFCACAITFHLASNTILSISLYEECIWNIRKSFHASKVIFARNAAPFAVLFLRIRNHKILWCYSNEISHFRSVQFHQGFHRTCPHVRVIRKMITDRKASHLVSTVNRGSGNWRRNIHTNFRFLWRGIKWTLW